MTRQQRQLIKQITWRCFGGIIAGLIAGYTYNRFKDTKLPEYLGFFSGRRLVPILTAIITIILAGIFGVVWPPIQSCINSFGEWMLGLGGIGAGIFGLFNRLLIPLGLHHVLNNIFWFQFGEYNGVTGDLARFFRERSDCGHIYDRIFPNHDVRSSGGVSGYGCDCEAV
ncbi:PTS system N-acetylglucosamine-specific transporter subunit IICB [Bacillus subtilis]|nr:PTS system N-acetylglucosamine-specific transporter subunit IICB [Bacillus subtilis]